jgi:hypothetical protein
MVNNDKQRFSVILSVIAEYYSKTISPNMITIYWEGLREYDLEAIEKALWLHTQDADSGQFMPKIADINKFLKGKTADRAAQAWSKVDAGIRQVGTYTDVVFDDAIIHRVILDMGGWIFLGSKQEKDWPFVANEFQNRYRGYLMQGETPDYPSVLIGISNANNRMHGFDNQPPRFIGQQHKAQLVMEGGSKKALLEMQAAADQVKHLALS